jgi:PhzF family phenazine biosynthesis protein
MKIAIYQIDAFTDSVFSGNPAAICPLDEWLPEETMLAIAAENNLSETAFFVRTGDSYALRWFTPASEVDLCGHATLATAHLLLNHLAETQGAVAFDTKSGRLEVRQDGARLVMNFPARPAIVAQPEPGLIDAVGKAPLEVLTTDNYMLVYGSEADVLDITPDMGLLASLGKQGAIVTAPGDACDFVSRYFAPAVGIPEDPVTGSTHCTLTPYWSARLGKKALSARQVSKRGGSLTCTDLGDRVAIAGQAVLYLQGDIKI